MPRLLGKVWVLTDKGGGDVFPAKLLVGLLHELPQDVLFNKIEEIV